MMSIPNYKQTNPRSKDPEKVAANKAAKVGGNRKRGNTPGPSASAASSLATGATKSGKNQVKNNSLNSILPFLIRGNSTKSNKVKITNLNKKTPLTVSPNICAQTGSNKGDTTSQNPWSDSNRFHAQKGSENIESIQSIPTELSFTSPIVHTSNANLQDCTIYGQSFTESFSDEYDFDNNDNNPIIVYPFIDDNDTIVPINEFSLLQEKTVTEEDYVEDYEGNKRPISDLDDLLLDGRNEAKRNRGEGPPRLSYANCAKEFIMVEFRASNPKVQLRQEDYGHIEAKLAFAYATLPKPRPPTIPKVYQMGLSQGAIWCACKDHFTYNFCLEYVPAFDTPDKYLPNPLLPPKPKAYRNKKGTKPVKQTPDDPELIRQWEIPENQLVYTYQVFGPDNRPFRYLKGRFPKDLWANHDDFIEMLRAFHPDLDQDIEDSRTGQPRKYHMRVSAGMEDKTDIVGGYFTLSIEVEEDLMPVLARLDGALTILSTTIKLVGGGIDKAIEDLNAPPTDINTDDFPNLHDDNPIHENLAAPSNIEDVMDGNNESLWNGLEEGDGNYMLDDADYNEDTGDIEDPMDLTDANPSNPSNN